MVVYPNGTLIINNVQEYHEGYYVCKASNGIGLDLDRIVHLKVHGIHFCVYLYLIVTKITLWFYNIFI